VVPLHLGPGGRTLHTASRCCTVPPCIMHGPWCMIPAHARCQMPDCQTARCQAVAPCRVPVPMCRRCRCASTQCRPRANGRPPAAIYTKQAPRRLQVGTASFPVDIDTSIPRHTSNRNRMLCLESFELQGAPGRAPGMRPAGRHALFWL
jgi:hypothetical protein